LTARSLASIGPASVIVSMPKSSSFMQPTSAAPR
jgi:hypothetical protein